MPDKCNSEPPTYCNDMLDAIKEGKIEIWGFLRNIRYNSAVDTTGKKLEIYRCPFPSCKEFLPYMWDTMKGMVKFLQDNGIEEKYKSDSPIFLNRQKSSESK